MILALTYNLYIREMALLLQDFAPHMVMSKIICSQRPPSYNIIATWANVPVLQQTEDSLEERVARHEQLMKIQSGLDDRCCGPSFLYPYTTLYVRAFPHQERTSTTLEHEPSATAAGTLGIEALIAENHVHPDLRVRQTLTRLITDLAQPIWLRGYE